MWCRNGSGQLCHRRLPLPDRPGRLSCAPFVWVGVGYGSPLTHADDRDVIETGGPYRRQAARYPIAGRVPVGVPFAASMASCIPAPYAWPSLTRRRVTTRSEERRVGKE